WAIGDPDFVKSAIVIASSPRLSAQSIAFDAVGRNAILADPHCAGGQYHDQTGPDRGLAIARMIGHITYLSEHSMHKKFGRNLRKSENYKYDFNSEFAVETYLDYQGQQFVERFDANSYLYITKAMDYFDLKKDNSSLRQAFEQTRSRFLIVSFTSDWLFPPAQSKEMADALLAGGKDVSYCNIETPYGHDAFLLEPDTLGSLLSDFIHATRHPDEALAAQICSAEDNCGKVTSLVRARVDYALIESLIQPGNAVLDTGCGNGELLARLMLDKNIKAKGIELDEKLVLACVRRGIPIIQHDIEQGLANCADKSFDYVILSQTVQTVRDPEKVFSEVLRVGKKVIVSFPNFAHWKARLQLLTRGKAPVTEELPFNWYDSPNTHFLSLRDFDNFCRKMGVTIEKRIPLHKNRLSPVNFAANLFAEQAIYVTSRA
ncbi:MAG: methionine biosynthesis protein MetW, partial [Phycisphaerae bacterium]|nr:methionine biosynthesis protein MetW [Phycisphaerae bacterium]